MRRRAGRIDRVALAFSLVVGFVAYCFVMPNVCVLYSWRFSRSICHNNIRNIGMAVLEYEKAHGVFPSDIVDASGKPLLSWRVAILPFIEQQELYDRFMLDEPWDSPHNKPLLAEMPPLLRCPDTEPEPKRGWTQYLGFAGPHAAFEPGRRLTKADFADDPAGTILVVETEAVVPWTKPADLPFDPATPGGFFGACSWHYVPDMWGRRRAVGFHAAFADGATRTVPIDFDRPTFKALITRDGGEPVDPTALPADSR